MEPKTLFWIIIGILTADFLFERVLDYLNKLKFSDKLPNELTDIYSEAKYRKSQQYFRIRYQYSFVVSTISFFALMTVFFIEGFAILDDFLRNYTTDPILLALMFFAVIGLASDLFGIPFSAYYTFVIEEKFGFNKTTPKTFMVDKVKTWFLSIIFGGGLLIIIMLIWIYTGAWFWVLAWIAVTMFSVFMSVFYSDLIVPFFNKQTPLESGPLRDEIEAFASKVGFNLANIYVMDGSKRSTKSNAYFTGLGKRKRIVLFDTLIEEHSINELVAVLAHEIGHYKKKHILQTLLLSTIETGILLYLFSLLVNSPVLSEALGVSTPSFHIGLLVFGIIYRPLSMLLGILMNYISRKNEYEADRFSGENYDAGALRQALKKLSVNHLSNLRPHSAYVFVHYSHPPLLKRLDALEELDHTGSKE